MKQPATTEKMEATDAAILWYGIDRTNRQKTGEARVPHGTFKTAGDALAAFRKLRATMHEYAQGTSEDLRSRKLARGKHGRLPVVPDDLDALAAAHPADSRDQGGVGISEELEELGRRDGRAVGEARHSQRTAGSRSAVPQSAASSEGVPDRRSPKLHVRDLGPAACCLGGQRVRKSMQQTYLPRPQRRNLNDFVRHASFKQRTRWPTRWLPVQILADFRGLTR